MQRLMMKIAITTTLVLSSSTAGFSRMPGDPLKPGFDLYSRQQDIDAGKEAAAQVKSRYQQVQNRDLQAYISALGQRLAKTPTAANSGFPFTFTLLNYKQVNAFALPGGPTFVFTGLLKLQVVKQSWRACLRMRSPTSCFGMAQAAHLRRTWWRRRRE